MSSDTDCTQARSEKALLAERLREEAKRAAKDAEEAELRARAVKESGQTGILLQAARRSFRFPPEAACGRDKGPRSGRRLRCACRGGWGPFLISSARLRG